MVLTISLLLSHAEKRYSADDQIWDLAIRFVFILFMGGILTGNEWEVRVGSWKILLSFWSSFVSRFFSLVKTQCTYLVRTHCKYNWAYALQFCWDNRKIFVKAPLNVFCIDETKLNYSFPNLQFINFRHQTRNVERRAWN